MADSETKTCTKCLINKAVEEFSFRYKARNKRHPWCRPCTRVHNKNRYYANHRHYSSHHNTLTKNKRQEKMLKVIEYLQKHPCVDCGECDPIVLEFDHRDNTEKVRAVAELVAKNFGWEKIFSEIEKCDVRCANCHRRRTATKRGYVKTLLLK